MKEKEFYNGETWEEFEKAKLAGELDSDKESQFADPEYTTWEEFQKQSNVENTASGSRSQNSSKNLFRKISVIFLCVLLWVALLAVYVFCIFYPTVEAINMPVDGILAISMDLIFFIASIIICVKVGKTPFLKAKLQNLEEEFNKEACGEQSGFSSNSAPVYKTSSARVPLKVGAVLLGCFAYGLIVTRLKSLGIAPGGLLAIVIAAPCIWLMRFLSPNAGSKYSPTTYVVANPDKGNFDKNPRSEDYNINYNTSSTVQVKKTKTSAITSSFKLSFKGIVGKICGSIFVSVLSWVSYFTAMEFYIRSYVRGVVDVRANYYDWSISKVHERYDGLIFTIKTGASENPLDSTIFDECYLAVVCGITVLCVAFIVFSIVHNNRRRDKM
jgi:hypothetical protein|nr:MAG TPA: hypothetical protein [Caudoviricetes sp.]